MFTGKTHSLNVSLVIRGTGKHPTFLFPFHKLVLSLISRRHQLLLQMGKAATNLTPSISMQAHQALHVTPCLAAAARLPRSLASALSSKLIPLSLLWRTRSCYSLILTHGSSAAVTIQWHKAEQ